MVLAEEVDMVLAEELDMVLAEEVDMVLAEEVDMVLAEEAVDMVLVEEAVDMVLVEEAVDMVLEEEVDMVLEEDTAVVAATQAVVTANHLLQDPQWLCQKPHQPPSRNLIKMPHCPSPCFHPSKPNLTIPFQSAQMREASLVIFSCISLVVSYFVLQDTADYNLNNLCFPFTETHELVVV